MRVSFEKVFEDVKAHVRVIEIRKRELLLAHCIIFMTPQSKTKLLDTEFIDSIFSAEIPSATSAPVLRLVVLKHNMHNVGGTFNLSAVCMNKDVCTKWFPEEFKNEKGHENAQFYVEYRQ